MRTIAITGQGYMHAAQSIDYQPYQVTATITENDDQTVHAVINNHSTPVYRVIARPDHQDDMVEISIDTGTHEAIITMPNTDWELAATQFNQA